ncbi:MAG TPA: hypothetical protein VIL46_10075 [Gemmataceae bacterium]
MAGQFGSFPPVERWEQLEKLLREELAYCGCDHYEEAVFLLRDVLRAARGWEDALSSDKERLAAARVSMLERLGYEQNPGLATWFLYWLDSRGLLWHGSRASVCGITRKGRWLLDAIERLYPPPEPDEETPE